MFKLFVVVFVALFAMAAAKPSVLGGYVAPSLRYASPYYGGAYAAAPYYNNYYGSGYGYAAGASYYGAGYGNGYGYGLNRFVY